MALQDEVGTVIRGRRGRGVYRISDRGQKVGRQTYCYHLPNFFRKPYGPGWALVGDAGHFKDPVLAHGMSDAFHDAELLAEAIDSGLTGRRPLQEAFADYEQRRNETALPLYELNCQMATLEPPPPEMRPRFSALRSNPVEANRYMATLAGTVSPAEFFAPENMARIMNGLRQ